jgi:putative mycofactocin binding protein MftB
MRPGDVMQQNSVYRLAEGVQVRSELFGLLFYDYRGPRLYFVPSRNLIDETFFAGEQPVAALLERICAENAWPRERVRAQVSRLLEKLEERELVHEQSIC